MEVVGPLLAILRSCTDTRPRKFSCWNPGSRRSPEPRSRSPASGRRHLTARKPGPGGRDRPGLPSPPGPGAAFRPHGAPPGLPGGRGRLVPPARPPPAPPGRSHISGAAFCPGSAATAPCRLSALTFCSTFDCSSAACGGSVQLSASEKSEKCRSSAAASVWTGGERKEGGGFEGNHYSDVCSARI